MPQAPKPQTATPWGNHTPAHPADYKTWGEPDEDPSGAGGDMGRGGGGDMGRGVGDMGRGGGDMGRGVGDMGRGSDMGRGADMVRGLPPAPGGASWGGAGMDDQPAPSWDSDRGNTFILLFLEPFGFLG